MVRDTELSSLLGFYIFNIWKDRHFWVLVLRNEYVSLLLCSEERMVSTVCSLLALKVTSQRPDAVLGCCFVWVEVQRNRDEASYIFDLLILSHPSYAWPTNVFPETRVLTTRRCRRLASDATVYYARVGKLLVWNSVLLRIDKTCTPLPGYLCWWLSRWSGMIIKRLMKVGQILRPEWLRNHREAKLSQ